MRTLLSARQMDLRTLFEVKDVLNAKGFEVTKEGVGDDLLLPNALYRQPNYDILFDAFNDTVSRNEILEKIKDPLFNVSAPAALPLTSNVEFTPDRNRFSTTFEWFIGEIMVRNFSAFSFAYGVDVKDVYRNSIVTAQTGDYDTLVISRDVNVIYFECKTGKFNKDKILKCVERAIALHCETSIMFIETLNVNSLKGCLSGLVHPIIIGSHLKEINIKGNIDSKVYEWNNCFFAIASGNIQEQLRTILRMSGAKKTDINYTLGLDDQTYSKMGYDKTDIPL